MNQNRGKSLALLVLALLLVVFIRQSKEKTAAEATDTRDGVTAVFSTTPASPKAMEPVTASLTLTDANGRALEGATMTFDLTMPGMIMPPNQPEAVEKSPGLYSVDTTFTMSGNWRAAAIITRNDQTTLFNFDFRVK